MSRDKNTAKAGWYRCLHCQNPVLISTEEAMRRFHMSRDNKGRLLIVCPNCRGSGDRYSQYRYIEKMGLWDSLVETWGLIRNIRGGGSEHDTKAVLRPRRDHYLSCGLQGNPSAVGTEQHRSGVD